MESAERETLPSPDPASVFFVVLVCLVSKKTNISRDGVRISRLRDAQRWCHLVCDDVQQEERCAISTKYAIHGFSGKRLMLRHIQDKTLHIDVRT